MLDDPLAIVVQAVFVLAAGMYPVGFLFGTCSLCCCQSNTCDEFDLEEAFSCRRGGTTYCENFTQGPPLLSLAFSETCYGSGAAGTVEGLGADVGPGPLQSVTLTEGGSGYAKLGRQAPELTLDNEHTSPATVSFTLAQSADDCGLPLWSIESIAVTDGGEGYVDGEVTIGVADGDTVVAAAVGTITTVWAEPTIKASTANGTGATFTVSVAEVVPSDPVRWEIDDVSFTGSPTSGFVDGESVTFSGDNLVELFAAEAVVRTVRQAPAVSASPGNVGGSGASLTVNLTSNANTPETWSISSVTINNPGTGYSVGNDFPVTVVTGTEVVPDLLLVSQVGANGEILDVQFSSGEYYDDTDELDYIELTSGGQYYRNDGEIDSIDITDGGLYYREDPELEPYVDAPVVTVQQILPSAGFGAEIVAVVDDDTSSPTFGEVIALNLDNAGDDYLAWEYISDFEYLGEGKFAFSYFGVRDWQNPQKGCWVSGAGIEFGTEVTDASAETSNEPAVVVVDGCATYDPEPDYTGRMIVTVSPVPTGEVECVTFCGQSGLCGTFPTHPPGEGFGPYGGEVATYSGDWTQLRRMCVRWICRCYEGTGKRGEVDPETQEPLYDPSEWYEVQSTTTVGGPIVFGDLVEKLDDAEAEVDYDLLEHLWLFGFNNWQATEGSVFCVVWAVVFYGTSSDEDHDWCASLDEVRVTAPVDVYTIHPCDRCSCQ